jgi:hypothetical protein
MKNRIFLAACYILCQTATVCSAQTGGQPQAKGHSFAFRSEDYLGFSSGEWGTGGLIQTVNGFYKGPWFLGLGTGLDNYRFLSVPLFLSLTRDLTALGKRSGIFVTLDAGTNLPWYTRKHTMYDGFTSSTFYPGPYWSARLGYKWKPSARTGKALLFSAGYTMKKLREDETDGQPPCPYGGPCNAQAYVYEYVNRTLFLMIGFQF